MVRFSLITVTYNAAQWIERTIQSIITQSYPHIEYIIIDGASTDTTLSIIKNFQLSTFNFQLVSEPDQGLYDAMNKGLQLATGDYVWFLNAGDTLHSINTLQETAALLKKTLSLPEIIYGETMIVDAQGFSLGLRRLKAPEKLTWKSFRAGMLVCHQSFVVKREIASLFDLQYRYASDFDWCIRSLKKATSVYNTHLTLSCFLDGGLSAAQRKSSLKERYRIMCNYYGILPTMIRHLWFAVRFYWAKWIRKKVC
jgi:glycosyltransferase involved in cell wall biosynthesis